MITSQRLFFALWPNPSLQNRIYHATEKLLKPWQGQRLKARQLHITLVFLGQISPATQSCLRDCVSSIQMPAFDLELCQLGIFRRSQVIWLGAQNNPPALLELQKRLKQAQASCGLQPESRPYSPHMTLMRKANDGITNMRTTHISWPIRDFALVESKTLATGAEYRVVARWPLVNVSNTAQYSKV